MLGPIRGQVAEDAGCFPRRSCTPIESPRRTPRGRLRGSPELVQSPTTSRCHPGCLSPELQELSEAHFCQLPASTQQAVQSPRTWTVYAWDLDSLTSGLDEIRPGAASTPPTLGLEDDPRPAPDALAFVRLPKELKEALKVLGRPGALWPEQLCKELRKQAMKRCGPEEAALLQKLQRCVQLATEYTLKRGFYEVEGEMPGYQKVYMEDVLSPSLKVRWFGPGNTQLPETKVDIGKALPPPLIVSDASCLDVVERLRSLESENTPGRASREIFVVTELFDFDPEGAARLGVASQRPHCMTLRTDLRRFLQHAASHMKRKRLTLQKVLCDHKTPQIFLAADVACLRGSQGDGYPFLKRPFQHHVLGMALWTARPRLQTARDSNGERTTMYTDSDDAKAYEVRLELCAHAALLAAGGVDLPKEEKPILVLPVVGLGGSSFHPQDSIVLSLKRFRRRFTQFFHSVYVCCGDRGPNYSLSDFIESAVNRSVYMMAQNDSLAAKALPWHWDQRELQMSIAAARLEKIGHHMRQGPTYVVKIKDDRRSAERKKLTEKVEVHHGFGTLRAYQHRKQLQAAEELIKAQRRQGDWPADHVHVKLGGLRDNTELAPEFENTNLAELRRKSLELKMSMTKIDSEIGPGGGSSPKSPLAKDLGHLQDLMLSVRQSSKTRSFRGWLEKADQVTQQLGTGGQVLLHAKRRSRKSSVTVEAVIASEDVQLDRVG